VPVRWTRSVASSVLVRWLRGLLLDASPPNGKTA
jgi:hypothetical protein